MKKVYISSHDIIRAKYLAGLLRDKGYKVVSSWHDNPSRGSVQDMADDNFRLIRKCDVLVLDGGRGFVTGGKYVEAGYALGLSKDVICFGDLGNILMHSANVTEVESEDQALLSGLES